MLRHCCVALDHDQSWKLNHKSEGSDWRRGIAAFMRWSRAHIVNSNVANELVGTPVQFPVSRYTLRQIRTQNAALARGRIVLNSLFAVVGNPEVWMPPSHRAWCTAKAIHLYETFHAHAEFFLRLIPLRLPDISNCASLATLELLQQHG